MAVKIGNEHAAINIILLYFQPRPITQSVSREHFRFQSLLLFYIYSSIESLSDRSEWEAKQLVSKFFLR